MGSPAYFIVSVSEVGDYCPKYVLPRDLSMVEGIGQRQSFVD
jgi:hypothetical protein